MKTTSTCSGCGGSIPESIIGNALCTACRYHDAPPKSQAIERDNAEFEAAVAGYAKPIAVERDEAAIWKAEFFNRWIGWIVGTGNDKSARQREAIVAHIIGKSGVRTDAQLAKKLNISTARISQIRANFIEQFGKVGKINSRQK